MENQEKLMQFVTWLGENVPELKGKAPEQIVETVNKLSASEQGQQMLQGLIKEFESSMTGMFKKGGKLGYLLCLKSGGSIQDCGCGKKIRKGQDGIDSMEELPSSSPKYSRRDAVKAAMSMGLNKTQSVNAYNTILSKVLDQGISGREARQAARANMINTAGEYAGRQLAASQPVAKPSAPALPVLDDVVIEDEPINFEPTTINLGEDKGLNIGPMDTFYGSFDDAFASARRSKLKEFTWNGKRWNTKLDNKQNDESFVQRAIKQNQQRSNVNQDMIASEVQEAKNAPKWYQRMGKAFNAGVMANELNTGILQQGGVIRESLPVNLEQYPHASRKDAIDAARQLGFEGSDARRAYGDSKKMARQLGFRGDNLRQVARYNLIDMAYPRAGMTEEESMDNLLNNFTTKISYN